jgi:uncharacterized protein
VYRADTTELVLSPSDLTAFLACEHRSKLDRLVAEGLLERPEQDDPELEILRRHGDEHERRELERLRAEGRTIVEIRCDESTPEALRAAEAETVAAMHAGADVIFQATFFDGRWRGHADFLLRVETPSDLGAWSYEIADTKLARRAKPAAVLQLCAYAEQLARIQGRLPDELEVVTGDGERHRVRVADAYSYYRAAKRRLEEFAAAAPDPTTYPHPVAHCSVCPWLPRCEEQRRADDHLSLVAGMRRDLTVKFGRAGITTLSELATSVTGKPVAGMSDTTADRLRHQARLQFEQRTNANGIRWELLPPDGASRGLVSLPPPSPGDVFFDMEGDPWVGDHGIEYLFGVVASEPDGLRYHAFWAHDEADEKRAFEQLVDFLVRRLDDDPAMHVYHYAPYEEVRLKTLAGRHGTREAEVDRLLRGEVLVDLYRIVRQSVRVGQEGYGLKKLEPLYLDAREGEISDGGSSIVAYEQWIENGDDALLEAIRAYNELDCLSTLGLRDWLEQRRLELIAQVGELPRPEALDGLAPEEIAEADERAEKLAAALLEDERPGNWLLAQLLGWHRREARPEWWAWFDRLQKTDEELVADHECIGDIRFVEIVEDLGRSARYRYAFDPTQEHKFGVGDKPVDPRTEKGAGEIVAVDAGAGFIDLKRGKGGGWEHPRSLVPPKPIGNKAQQEAVARIAEDVLDDPNGDPPRRRAVLDLLRREPPRVRGVRAGEPLQQPGESGSHATRQIVRALDGACLAVQGPPGAGKTWTGAAVIVDAVRAGRRVGVTAQSHKAIGNLLEAVVDRARKEGERVRILQKAGDDQFCGVPGVRCTDDNKEVVAALADGTVDVVAGTAWLFARLDMDATLDLLVIDEAGQRSLADVLAVSGAATNIVLLGDPQQLAQVSKGSHPAGAELSALEHILEDHATVPPERGIFLDRTHRMHPEICEYVSSIAYDGRLRSVPGCDGQSVSDGPLLSGSGLRWVPVAHEANRTRAPEEAAAVARLIDELVGHTWVDANGQQSWLTLQDILVITPYNAQVAELADALPDGARVGTVDRFQGQEAPIAIYSLAASSADDVPRGLDFLLSVNRLNVAVSRARALAVVVGSPALLRAPCNTLHQLRLANALCRFVEDATTIPL